MNKGPTEGTFTKGRGNKDKKTMPHMVIIKYFMQDTSLLGFLIVCITNGHRHIRICSTQYV